LIENSPTEVQIDLSGLRPGCHLSPQTGGPNPNYLPVFELRDSRHPCIQGYIGHDLSLHAVFQAEVSIFGVRL
jgi:hypothetical protein